MPPLPGASFLREFGKEFGNFTGLYKTSEHPEDHNDESHARARSEDMDDMVEQPSAGIKKRSREAHEDQSQNTKKQRTFSQEDGAFFGKYNGPTPKDACRVMVPTNEQLDDNIPKQTEKATKVVRATKPLAGAHRTKNTLNQAQPGRNGARASVYTQIKPSTSRVAKAPPKEPMYGDGFNGLTSTKATPAKRRATNGASQAIAGKKPIDITGDSDEVTMGEVEAVNGNRVSSESQNSVIEVDSSHSPPKTGYFGAQEMRNVHQLTNPPPPKKRRQHSSTQGSAHNESHDQIRPTSRQTNHSVDLDDLNTPVSRFTVNRTKDTKRQKDGKPGIPKIDLGKGTDVEEIKAARDVNLVKGTMESRMYPRACTEAHAKGLPEIRNADADTRPHTRAWPEQRTIARELELEQSREKQRQEPRLGTLFRRVSNSPPLFATQQKQQQQESQHQQKPRQSRAKAMQVSSAKGSSGAVEDSPDQLQTTSPRLSRKPTQGRSSISANGESPRQISPSDIKPANFTSKTTKSTSVSQESRKAKKLSDRTDDPPTRIPITQIYSRGCPLSTGEGQKVELVWCEDKDHFEVERNGTSVLIPLKNETMSIGKREASTLHHSQDSTKLVLRGSASEGRSNGWILLEFPDGTSRDDCANYLVAASSTMNIKHESAEKMGKLYETQAKVVQADAEKCVLKILADMDVARQRDIEQTDRRRENRPTSEDGIVYEQPDGKSSNHVSVRSRILGNDKKSPYFQDQENQPRKSTRQSKAAVERSPSPDPVVERWTQANPQTAWHQSVMYPATGARRITVDFQDLERLDEGEFLNDNIVGYALRRIEENMSPEHKNKVHFFNSYFFTSLTSKNGRKTFSYESVKKWTKQKDIFNTPYVVVPINENLHWYVAIICNLPNLVRKPAALEDNTSDAAATPSTSQQASERPSPIRDPVVPDSQDVDGNNKLDEHAMQSLSIESERTSRDGSEVIEFGEDGKVASSSHNAHSDPPVQAKGAKKSKKRTAPALPKYPTDKPIIITLDSFGQAHTGQVASLKDYVAAEAMDKRGMEVGREDMKGMTATGVPLQQNFCDCGLYLVGYVAEFAKDPEGFVNKVLTRQLDGQSDFAAFDPSKKRDEIRDDLLRLHEEQDAERLALKKAKKESRNNKVPVTAVTDANTLVASAVTRPSPTRSTVEQSARAPPTTTTEAPSQSGKSRPSNSPGPDAALNARGKPEHSGSAPSNDASDNDEMEAGMPRALTSTSPPQKAKIPAESHTNSDDGEMLNNNHQDDDAIESRPRGMRKVLSPELDGLSSILNARPPAAPPQAHEKSSDSEKRSP